MSCDESIVEKEGQPSFRPFFSEARGVDKAIDAQLRSRFVIDPNYLLAPGTASKDNEFSEAEQRLICP